MPMKEETTDKGKLDELHAAGSCNDEKRIRLLVLCG